MNVTLRDLGLLTVFLTLIVAGVFLIRALLYLGGALRDIKKLIRDNTDGIDRVIKDLPKLSDNAVNLTELASDVAENLRNEQELIETTIESVSDAIESVSDTVRIINEDFLGAIKRLVKTLMTVAGFISKKKAVEQEAAGGVGESFTDTVGVKINTDTGVAVKPERRERRAKKPRMRSAAAAARKRQVEKGRNINIHIR